MKKILEKRRIPNEVHMRYFRKWSSALWVGLKAPGNIYIGSMTSDLSQFKVFVFCYVCDFYFDIDGNYLNSKQI